MKRIQKYIVKTEPTTLPLKLEDVYTFLRLDQCDVFDFELNLLIQSAVASFQEYTNRILIDTVYTIKLDYFYDGILLKKGNFDSVTSITYTNTSDVLTDITSDGIYEIVDNNGFGQLNLAFNSQAPTDVKEAYEQIEIDFKTGYGVDETYIPADVKLALLNYIAFKFSNRLDCPDVMSKDSQMTMRLFEKFKIYYITDYYNNCY